MYEYNCKSEKNTQISQKAKNANKHYDAQKAWKFEKAHFSQAKKTTVFEWKCTNFTKISPFWREKIKNEGEKGRVASKHFEKGGLWVFLEGGRIVSLRPPGSKCSCSTYTSSSLDTTLLYLPKGAVTLLSKFMKNSFKDTRHNSTLVPRVVGTWQSIQFNAGK